MPKFYLQPIDDPTQWLETGIYPKQPEDREGFIWVEGEIPQDATHYKVLTLAEQLDSVFMTLSAPVRAQFYALKAAIKVALESPIPDLEAARLIVAGVDVPSDLQEAKDQLLALLGGGS